MSLIREFIRAQLLARLPLASECDDDCVMRIIEIRPSKKFRKHWEAFEGDGVQSAFPTKQHATDYACGRFGGTSGEIHVYNEAGEEVAEKISLDGQGQYTHA